MSDIRGIAVVTGGNRGIGLEICRQLAAHGYDVLLGSRDLRNGQLAVQRWVAARRPTVPQRSRSMP